jgi:hypothetical protein
MTTVLCILLTFVAGVRQDIDDEVGHDVELRDERGDMDAPTRHSGVNIGDPSFAEKERISAEKNKVHAAEFPGSCTEKHGCEAASVPVHESFVESAMHLDREIYLGGARELAYLRSVAETGTAASVEAFELDHLMRVLSEEDPFSLGIRALLGNPPLEFFSTNQLPQSEKSRQLAYFLLTRADPEYVKRAMLYMSIKGQESTRPMVPEVAPVLTEEEAGRNSPTPLEELFTPEELLGLGRDLIEEGLASGEAPAPNIFFDDLVDTVRSVVAEDEMGSDAPTEVTTMPSPGRDSPVPGTTDRIWADILGLDDSDARDRAQIVPSQGSPSEESKLDDFMAGESEREMDLSAPAPGPSAPEGVAGADTL